MGKQTADALNEPNSIMLTILLRDQQGVRCLRKCSLHSVRNEMTRYGSVITTLHLDHPQAPAGRIDAAHILEAQTIDGATIIDFTDFLQTIRDKRICAV